MTAAPSGVCGPAAVRLDIGGFITKSMGMNDRFASIFHRVQPIAG